MSLLVVPPAAGDDQARAAAGAASPEDKALARAASTGERVEIEALRGESREVYAEPSGDLSAVQHLQPVRTRKHGAWASIDTRLERKTDGSIGPVAASVDLEFSGGGTAPMVRVGDMGRELSLTWPGGLPAPSLDGDTAEYKDVIAGVDLRLRAQADGFAQLLVVKTPEAATSPALRQLRFALGTSQLQVSPEASGLKAVDPVTQDKIFEAPEARMWDSGPAEPPAARRSGSGDASRAGGDSEDGPKDGAKVADIKVGLSGDQLTLEPDQRLLTGSDTHFPVYIDPETHTARAIDGAWLMVSDNAGKDYKFTGSEGVGYCQVIRDSRCGDSNHRKRLFFRIPVAYFKGKTIIQAQFRAYETAAWDCEDPRSVRLWETSGFGTESTWNSTDDNWKKNLTGREVAKCDSGGALVGFPQDPDASNVIRDHLVSKFKANPKIQTLTFGLRAYDETSMDWWKRFKGNAELWVKYNRTPNRVSTSKLFTRPNGLCNSRANPWYTNSLDKLALYAAPNGLTDPDREDAGKLSAQFGMSWGDNADGTAGWKGRWVSTLKGPVTSGTPVQMSVKNASPAVTIPQKTKIGWHIRGKDSLTYGPWSYTGGHDDCYFVYDPTIPDPPTITSKDGRYPEWDPEDPDGGPHHGVGRYGTFTLKSNDAAKFRIGLNTDPSTAWEVPAVNDTAEVTLAPSSPGINSLTVQAVTRANQASKSYSTYQFNVDAEDPTSRWALDENAGAAQFADTGTPGGQPADLQGGVELGVAGQQGKAATFNGTDGYASTSGPTIDTSTGQSFSVAAWARLPTTLPTTNGVVATQTSTTKPGFELYYSAGFKQWVFNRYDADSATAGLVRAKPADPGTPGYDPKFNAVGGAWTHLAGTYDARTAKMRLYINGLPAGEADYPAAKGWKALGPLQIGAGRYGGGARSLFFPGDIDDVQTFDRPLGGGEVRELSVSRPVVAGRWKLNETSPATTGPTRDLGAHVSLSPSGASIVGAASGDARVGAGALKLDGQTGYAETASPAVDTSGSFSISAWMGTTDRPPGTVTAYSLPGVNNCALTVRYVSEGVNEDGDPIGHWELSVPSADAPSGTIIRSVTNDAFTDRWNLITVTYHAVDQEISLWVNAELQAADDETSEWPSVLDEVTVYSPTKFLRLGAGGSQASRNQFWPGQVDDVWVFRGALSQNQVEALANGAELVTDSPIWMPAPDD